MSSFRSWLEMVLVLLAAISYLFEAESERRKQGLQSRVTFLDKKNSDQDFQSTGTLELQRQNKRACFRSKLRLQVAGPFMTLSQ